MKIYNRQGLFDEQNVLEKLTKLGDPLVLVSQHIDFTLLTLRTFINILKQPFDLPNHPMLPKQLWLHLPSLNLLRQNDSWYA